MTEQAPTALYVIGGLIGAAALYMGFAEGKAPLQFHYINRDKHPFWFWLLMSLYGFTTAAAFHGIVFG